MYSSQRPCALLLLSLAQPFPSSSFWSLWMTAIEIAKTVFLLMQRKQMSMLSYPLITLFPRLPVASTKASRTCCEGHEGLNTREALDLKLLKFRLVKIPQRS